MPRAWLGSSRLESPHGGNWTAVGTGVEGRRGTEKGKKNKLRFAWGIRNLNSEHGRGSLPLVIVLLFWGRGRMKLGLKTIQD